MDGREPFVSKCPGQTRIPHLMGWFVKQGQSPFQGTYCAVCVEHGCAGCSRSTVTLYVCRQTFCDCPDPTVHAGSNFSVDLFQCLRCSERRGFGFLAKCRNCSNEGAGPNNKLCDYCSNVLGRCRGCGKQKLEIPALVKLLDLPVTVYLALLWAMSYELPPPIFVN